MQKTGLSRVRETIRDRTDRLSILGVTLTDAFEEFTGRWSDQSFWLEASEIALRACYDRRPPQGIDVMAQDWDTLIILDACRYDLFEEKRPDDWSAPLRVRSRASATTEFYQKNFTDGPYLDTVLVTANPKAVQERGDAFHDVVKVYETDWNEDLGTVLPEVMARATVEAHEHHPDKRILSHWIQPHYPFIGGDTGGYRFNDDPIWRDLRRGNIDLKQVYEDYAATLEMTIPHVQNVLDAVEGRVVLTSDHGNAFGERPWFYPFPIYGHPTGIQLPGIVDVPWSVIDCGPRRDIVADEGRVVDAGDDDEIQDRLEKLGYA